MSGSGDPPSPDPPLRNGLRCVRGSGLSIPQARGLRVDVADGALRVHRPDQPVEIVGAVGELASASWLNLDQTRHALGPPPPLRQLNAFGRKIGRVLPLGRLGDVIEKWHGGSVVIAGPDGPALSFYVDSFTPWAGTPEQKQISSGAADLARSLGLTLQPATDTALPDRAKARAALVEPRRTAPAIVAISLGLTLLAGVLTFLSMPYGESTTGLVLSAASLAAIAPVLTLLVRYRRRFDTLVTSPPPHNGRTVYQPPPEAIGELATHVQFGRDDVVLVDAGGREWWIPGPARGGVTTCAVDMLYTEFLDGDRLQLLALRTEHLATDNASHKRFAAAADSAGITVAAHHIADASTPDLRYEFGAPGLTFTEWERGRITYLLTVLVPAAGILHLMGAIILAGAMAPWGYLAPVGSIAWLSVRGWTGLRYRRWRNHIHSQAQPGQKPDHQENP